MRKSTTPAEARRTCAASRGRSPRRSGTPCFGRSLWFLENAAGEGLELTKDGYLKPATVGRALDELGWRDESTGKGNREVNTPDS